ncbi:hypothetical protein [Sandaracinus amylolyticus]|uniref:hypothetical protein n=1 Tax=Sandaracinus amylolyticus TaxID=927083 RepID=UPI001F258492|nr:hypothetical protein [Sandaracinus amylolyticus]UJR84546.1 Hypothetical protein I5071_66250 [Sandaracinus amylolyticus]
MVSGRTRSDLAIACALGLALTGCVGVISGPLGENQPPPTGNGDAGRAPWDAGAQPPPDDDAGAPPIDEVDAGADDPEPDSGVTIPLDPDAGTPDPGGDAGPEPDPGAVAFSEIVSILNGGRCGPCHTSNEAGGLRISTNAAQMHRELTGDARASSECSPADYRVVPGQPGQSALYQRLVGSGCGVMPPSGGPVSAAALETVRAWIEEGAIGPE